MPEEEKKSKYQRLEKKLGYSSKNIWEEVDDKVVKDIFDWGEKYKDFLNIAKSERLTINWIMENAGKRGTRTSLRPNR